MELPMVEINVNGDEADKVLQKEKGQSIIITELSLIHI